METLNSFSKLSTYVLYLKLHFELAEHTQKLSVTSNDNDPIIAQSAFQNI